MKKRERGFTLVEIMIVVATIGILSSIAIPNFANSRVTAARNVCTINAKQIQGALDVAAVSPGGGFSVANLTASDIEGIISPNYIRSMPVCSKGAYRTDESSNVICSYHNSSGGSVATTITGWGPGGK